MKAFRTIRGRMMVCYGIIILLTILVMSTIYFVQTAALLEDRASDALLQQARGTSAALDSVIENMDSTAQHIISSQLVKEAFYTSAKTPAEYLQNRMQLINLLFTVTGSEVDNQINLFSVAGKFVKFGQSFDVMQLAKAPLEVSPWMADCIALDGKMYLVSPRRYEWDPSNQIIFSVCRAFSSAFGKPCDAVVEVQMTYRELSDLLLQASFTDSVSAFLYDSNGECVYPLGGGLGDWAPSSEDPIQAVLPIGRGNTARMAAYCRSAYSGLTVVVTEHTSDMLAPIRAFLRNLVLVSVVLLSITIFITFLLSNQLTQPIRKIQKSISTLQLTALKTPDQYHASVYELDKLGNSYAQMAQRLQRSLEETVAARSHATEARMQALQSQLNPHFLYNTITILSIKAEDNEDYEVVAMCECLTGMLRYVTRGNSITVPLKEELDYLEQFLYLMRCRYQNRFTMDINIPEQMLDTVVPRLVLQPLVENSFKHGLLPDGPWTLSVTGAIRSDTWYLTVTDNGRGFPEDVLIKMRAHSAASAEDYRPVETEHIGLSNIFERLRFQYKERAIFKIVNLPEGGCSVTIGGSCSSAVEEEM